MSMRIRTTPILMAAMLAVLLMACGMQFEDESQSLLMKPELLSVVFDPPEAAPGDRVTASFLLADGRGVLEPNSNIWMPDEIDMMAPGVADGDEDAKDVAGALMDIEAVNAELEAYDLDLIQLVLPRIVFTVPDDGRYDYDDSGLATQMFSLIVDVADQSIPPEQMFADLMDYVGSGEVKMALRSLVVSEREEQNLNPRIISIRARAGEEGAGTDLSIIRHDTEDLPASRLISAQDPFVVGAGSEWTFIVEVADEGDLEEVLRYQWASTGGDFQGRRKQEQPWTAPAFKELESGDVDQSKQKDPAAFDPRLDPNLHAAWLILRDNGGDDSLGQAWAEFYLRVIPGPDENQ